MKGLARLGANSLFTSAESAEVLGSLRGLVEEVHSDAAGRSARDLNFEENRAVDSGFGLSRFRFLDRKLGIV